MTAPETKKLESNFSGTEFELLLLVEPVKPLTKQVSCQQVVKSFDLPVNQLIGSFNSIQVKSSEVREGAEQVTGSAKLLIC